MLTVNIDAIGLIAYVLLYSVFTSIVANLVYAIMASFSDDLFERHKIVGSEVLLSMMSVCSKTGFSIASGIAPLALKTTGYLAQAAIQPTGSQSGIKILYIFFTAVGMAISGVFMLLSSRRRTQ